MHSGKRTVMAFLIAIALAAGAGAQARKRDVKRADEKPAPSVSLVERAPANYLSGEANVAVSGNQNPVIKLGLSPNGATIIEFPAADKLFNIIPGNSNLVTVEESPTKETDRFVIVRPGDGFASPTIMEQARRAPATSVIVQMTSGLVITFLFYPVPQLAEQAHRVVIIYDRNEVMAARRAAGLAVNLDSGAEEMRRATTSLRVMPTQNTVGPVVASASRPSPVVAAASRPSEEPGIKSQPPEELNLKSRPPGESDPRTVDLDDVAGVALAQAKKSPESFKKWSDDAHGLSISVLSVRELDSRSQLVVFAVRNAKKADVRVVPGQPEILVETVSNQGKLVTVDQVKKLAERTTAKDGLIPGKKMAYYAIVHESPILGARQRLRVAVGQTKAADEPSIAFLHR
ncbi:MAG: hypothetical protein ACREA2_03245 [Blastocatellia bacterium]